MEHVVTQRNLLEDVWTLLGRPFKQKEPAWTSHMDARDILIAQQLPFTALTKLSVVLHINILEESADIFRISPKTLQRRKSKHRLNFIESVTVFQIAEVVAKATDVFNDREIAIQWLNEENRALGDRIPLSLLSDAIGRKLVEDVLGRIKHGIYS